MTIPDLALAVAQHDAPADLLAVLDLGHVGDGDRNPVDRLDLDGANLIEGVEKPQAPHEVLFGAGDEELPADVSVVGADGLDDGAQIHAVLEHRVRIDTDLELQDMTAH
jgi:hypothetical protein